MLLVFGLSAVSAQDGDGDGFPDGQDSCPTLPGPNTNTGCPDTDNDGIIDPNDSCPEQFGLIQYGGCPDSDNDGTSDNIDACPTEGGPDFNRGCPVDQPQPPPETVEPTPQINTLRPVPFGACNVTTLYTSVVNLRLFPDPDAPIVGTIDWYSMYAIYGVVLIDGQPWYKLDGGWVSGSVVIAGGNCGNLVRLEYIPSIGVVPYEGTIQSPGAIPEEECIEVVSLPQPLCYWKWIIPTVQFPPIDDGVVIDAVGDGGVEEIGDSSTYPRCDVLREQLISQHSTEWRLEGEYLVQYLIVNPDVPLPEPKPCVDDIFTTTYDPTGILIGLYQAQYESFPSDDWLADTAVNLEGILIGLSVNPQGILIGLSVDPTAILIGLSVNPEGILIGLSVDPTGILIGLSQPSAEEIPASENASITRFDYLAGTALTNQGDLFVGFNGDGLGAGFLNLDDINGD
jgi:hypothetical protein